MALPHHRTFSSPSLLSIKDIANDEEGWGPSLTAIPAAFQDIPYAPYGKSDKLGRVADWNAALFVHNKWTAAQSKARQKWVDSGVSTAFTYHAENDDEFTTVDNRPAQMRKTKWQKPRWVPRINQWNNPGKQRNQPKTTGSKRQQQPQRRKAFFKRDQNWKKPWNPSQTKPRDPSVEVKSDWRVEVELPFAPLSKLAFSKRELPRGEDIVKCGRLMTFNKEFLKIDLKSEVKLSRQRYAFFRVSTTEDPVMVQLARDSVGTVFATDTIIAALMVATRSIYSWDIIIDRVGDKLFFDKRDTSDLDLVSVNETSSDPPTTENGKDHFNAPMPLACEATFINQSFSQQVLLSEEADEATEFEQPNPFVNDEENVAAVGYRYRKFNLAGGKSLVVRCELDGVFKSDKGAGFATIKALNEYDPTLTSGVEWRSKLDTQRGAVLATELKNNANKLARWTAQALLADADMFVLGYVSRANPLVKDSHVVLGVQKYKPTEFAQQINLLQTNMWGVLEHIIDSCMKLPEGKYVLLKDPNKSIARIYSVPEGTFEEEGSDAEGVAPARTREDEE